MRCLACGKLLRARDSVINGYGPVCYQNIFGKDLKEKKREKDSERLQLPGQISMEEMLLGRK
ncbi:MAG: DUF6011 domain-containing protein [Lachnospiraceae bacterium]|nr:DUF6011 domain-containing protein [Lachnospiraceae bacterium]